MALFKVYESDVLQYRADDSFDKYVYDEVIASGYYMESIVRGAAWMQMLWGARGEIHETLNSHTTIYALYVTSTVDWPSWSVNMAAFDGQTGERLWTDYHLENAGNISMLLTDRFWQDLDGRIWGHNKYGHSIRYKRYTDESGTRGTASGMPNWLAADNVIQDAFWTDEDGVFISNHQSPLAILARANRAVVADGYYLRIHDYSTGKQLFRIPTSYGITDGFAVDDTTFYGVTPNGLINIIDYKEGIHKGFLSLGEEVRQPMWYCIGFDPVYRRMLTSIARADAPETRACTVFVEGFKLSILPEHLVAPIPLQVPRKGRVVPVYSRVVGSAALGVGGVIVNAVLTGQNALAPNKVTTDATGKVEFLWDCDVSGTDIDAIQLQVGYDEAAPGLDPPAPPIVVGVIPGSVVSKTVYHPGWWISINRNFSEASLSSIFTGYLDTYESNEEIPIVGVRLDYSWDYLDVTESGDCPTVVVDTTKLQADLAYLDSLGLRAIVNFESSTPYCDMSVKVSPPGCTQVATSTQCGCVWPHATDCGGWYAYYPEDPDILTTDNCYDARLKSRQYPSFHDADTRARFKTFFNAVHASIGSNLNLDGYGLGRLYASGIPGVGVSTYILNRKELLDYMESLTGKMAWEFTDAYTDGALDTIISAGNNCGIENLRMKMDMPFADHESGGGEPDTVAFSYRVDADAWTRAENEICGSPGAYANALQMAFGDVALEDCFLTVMDEKRPGFVFWEWDAAKWAGTNMIQEVCENYTLSKVKQYYGT